MSAVIKTVTPFVIEELLLEALEAVGAQPIKVDASNLSEFAHSGGIELGDIITNRSDYYGRQHFRFVDDRWVLRHDSSEMNARVTAKSITSAQYQSVAKFLSQVGEHYSSAHEAYLARLAEEERMRLEAERQALVDAVRQQTIDKGKAQGYSIRETRNSKNEIQLVLTRIV